MQRWIIPALLLGLVMAPDSRADLVNTFEEFNPGPNSAKPFFTASSTTSGSTPLVSQGNVFNNEYTYFNSDPVFGYIWSGWAVSSRTDRTTEGVEGQFSSVTGGGYLGSSTYLVGYTNGTPSFSNLGADPSSPGYLLTNPFHPSDSTINLAAGTTPVSIEITNISYAYNAFLRGDPYGFSPAFGAGDFQTLDIRGYDSQGHQIQFRDSNGVMQGAVTVSLADYRTAVPTVLNDWQAVDLTPLAGAVQLRFGVTSSQNGEFGVIPPTYFAADNFATRAAAVPEPTSVALLGLGLACLAAMRRGRARKSAALAAMAFLALPATSARAEFDPQVGQAGSNGISKDSPRFTEWASSVVSITRGPQDISVANSPLASFGVPGDALGPIGTNTSRLVSLGDGGQITLGFDRAITNGAGADFAVFENGFAAGGAGLAYLELGFVDVSSDGVNFFRFPATSLTPTTTQVASFGLLDARNLDNLAGKYIGGYGTGFNLDALAGVSPLLDVNHVIQVRITDVVGSIDPRFGSRDSLGNLVNDPFPTGFASGGFDLNGVGVINAVPEPASLALLTGGLVPRGWYYPGSVVLDLSEESTRESPA